MSKTTRVRQYFVTTHLAEYDLLLLIFFFFSRIINSKSDLKINVAIIYPNIVKHYDTVTVPYFPPLEILRTGKTVVLNESWKNSF